MRTYNFLGTNLAAALSWLSFKIEVLFCVEFSGGTANYATVAPTSTELALSPRELVDVTT
jgi:hypothetical protein